MYVPEEGERTFADARKLAPYLNKVFYEKHPKDENMFRTHMAIYSPLAMQGKRIRWNTTNWLYGTPPVGSEPFDPKLKSATMRFGGF